MTMGYAHCSWICIAFYILVRTVVPSQTLLRAYRSSCLTVLGATWGRQVPECLKLAGPYHAISLLRVSLDELVLARTRRRHEYHGDTFCHS